jgi:hypothetical protein
MSVGCSKNNNNSSSSKTDSVFYSPWIKLQMTSVGDTVYYQDIAASKLTQSLLSTGLVVGYLGYPNNGDTSVNNALEYGLYQIFDVGQVEVQSYGYLNDFSFSSSGLLYRYVLIPGTAITSTALKNFSKEQLKGMSLKDITKALSSSTATTDSASRLQ